MKYNSIIDAIDAHIDNLVTAEVIEDDSIKSQDVAVAIANLNNVYAGILEEDPPTGAPNTVADQLSVLLGYVEKFIELIADDTTTTTPDPGTTTPDPGTTTPDPEPSNP